VDARGLLGLVCLALTASACAHLAAKNATAGAMSAIEEKSGAAETGKRPSELFGERAVVGAVGSLSDPEQVARIRQVVAEASAQAAQTLTETISRSLTEQLGLDGAGPLGTSLQAIARSTATSATDGALHAFAPACAAGDTACVDRRVGELSRQAAIGFMRGVRDQVGLLLLGLAFLAGLATALGVTLALAILRARRISEQAALRIPPARLPTEQPT
jgi:hypothetical protein